MHGGLQRARYHAEVPCTTSDKEKKQDVNPLPAWVSDANSNRSQRQSVRLPQLIIEKFYGDVSMWQEFWSQYETAIHNNDSLCNKEKFIYLKTYLTGPAAKAVAGLMLTVSNYDNAIALLKQIWKERSCDQCSYVKAAESHSCEEIL